MPHQFQGFNVKNLTISNKDGQIKFPGTIDVQGIDFSQAIKIDRDYIEVKDDYLDKQTWVITMNNIPQRWESLFAVDPKEVERKLNEGMNKMMKNYPDRICKMLNFDTESKSFMYMI